MAGSTRQRRAVGVEGRNTRPDSTTSKGGAWDCPAKGCGCYPFSPVTWVLLIGTAVLLSSAAAVIVDFLRQRKRRRNLLRRLSPYQPRSVADEAQNWLNQQNR